MARTQLRYIRAGYFNAEFVIEFSSCQFYAANAHCKVYVRVNYRGHYKFSVKVCNVAFKVLKPRVVADINKLAVFNRKSRSIKFVFV